MTIIEELQKLRIEMRTLRQKTARQERSLIQLRDKIIVLVQGNNTLKKENVRLCKENEELKDKLDSTNNHKNKLVGMIFKTNKKSSINPDKLRGGQKGHQGYARIRAKHIDERKKVYLTHCPDCKHSIARSSRTYTRTVEDIPKPQPVFVTEYTIEKQYCEHCKTSISAIPVNTVKYSPFGVNIITMILTLKYNYRLPIAKIQEYAQTYHQLHLSQGTIQNILHTTKKLYGKEYQRILKRIRKAPYKHADETGWRVEGQNSWCWLFATPKEALYTIEETRGKGVVETILTKIPNGVLVRDDYGAYKHLNMPQQSCWTHLLRVSRDMESNEAKELHKKLKTMFIELKNLTETKIDKDERQYQYEKYLADIQDIINTSYTEKDTKKVQTRISNQNANLITALLYDVVPLTNNHAEQQIRPLTVQRKISGGSRSVEGAKTHAVNMSIVQTLKLRGTNLISGLQNLLTTPGQKFVVERGE